MSRSLRGSLLLLVAAVIWGSTFVAQSTAMSHIGPFSFQTARSFLAAGFLFLLAKGNDLRRRREGGKAVPMEKGRRNRLLIGGVCCGLALSVASNFQQLAISLAPDQSGKAGFVTALYILFVPLMGLLLKRRPPVALWLALPVALGGLYLLCLDGTFVLQSSDVFLLLCSVAYGVQILFCAHFAPGNDCLRLSAVQFLVTGVVSLILAVLFEREGFGTLATDLWAVWFELFYAAILSSGVAYTFQMLGQRDVHPTLASLFMSLEAVFALLSALVLQGQIPSVREWVGCALMFVAILVAQAPGRKTGQNHQKSVENCP